MRGSEFLAHVEPDDDTGCWMWQRYRNRKGYGQATVDGRRMLAHRAAWSGMVGEIPDGLTVDHECFRPGCVYPGHLQLLTHSENARRQRSALATRCSRGHPLGDGSAYVNPADGRRRCRVCGRGAAVRRRERAR